MRKTKYIYCVFIPKAPITPFNKMECITKYKIKALLFWFYLKLLRKNVKFVRIEVRE